MRAQILQEMPRGTLSMVRLTLYKSNTNERRNVRSFKHSLNFKIVNAKNKKMEFKKLLKYSISIH